MPVALRLRAVAVAVAVAAVAVAAVAAAYAVLGLALGFVPERSQGSSAAASLAPYACAVLGVLFWTRPPRGGRVG